MSKSTYTSGEAIGMGMLAIMMFVVMIGSSVLINALVLKTLWGWYVFPLFALPGLTYPYAIGLATIVRLVTHSSVAIKSEYRSTSESMISIYIGPFYLLLIGWFGTLFM